MGADTIEVCRSLPDGVLDQIFQRLHKNEIACSVRLLSKAIAARFNRPEDTTVRLSAPVPRHALPHQLERDSGAWRRSLTHKQRVRLLGLIATTGDLDNLKAAVAAADCTLQGEVMEATAVAGHLHVCCWLKEQGCPLGDALSAAAGRGHRDLCAWMLVCDSPADFCGACQAAGKGGHLELMEWLQQQQQQQQQHYAWKIWDVAAVAEGGDLATLQRVLAIWDKQSAGNDAREGDDDDQNGDPGAEARRHPEAVPQDARRHPEAVPQDARPARHAGRQGVERRVARSHVEECILAGAAASRVGWRAKVEWLLGQGFPRRVGAWWDIVGLPDAVERLQWLLEQGFTVDEFQVTNAAILGNLPALEFLVRLKHATLADHNTYIDVPREGHLHILQFFHARGKLGRVADCAAEAARHGHTAMVGWLLQVAGVEVAELQAHEVDIVSRSGSVELLRWARGRGWRWRADSLLFGVKAGCEEALEWMLADGCPMPADGMPYALAAANGDFAILKWLRRKGCPWGTADTFTTSVLRVTMPWYIRAPVRALAWLLDEGCPMDWNQALAAAQQRRDSVVLQWLQGRAAAEAIASVLHIRTGLD